MKAEEEKIRQFFASSPEKYAEEEVGWAGDGARR